jgi:hypothetical protein
VTELNVFATQGSISARRWWVGKSAAQPDENWIRHYTGIDPDSVTAVQKVRIGGETCWLIFLTPPRKKKRQKP